MIEFNCTVRDIFRRRNMIDKAVRTLAANGFSEHAATYAHVRSNMYNAMAYAASRMKEYEYEAAFAYLESREPESAVANKMFYTHRTIRRYIRKACEYVNEYYTDYLGIRLLPVSTRKADCRASGVTFWEKVNSLMDISIENACVIIAHCDEHMSVNSICSNYGMGSDKVKKIVRDFGAVVTVYNVPAEKRRAV